MAKQSRNSSQFLIYVNVTFPVGSPVYSYAFFGNGDNADNIMVAPGDQVGWFVSVEAGFGISTPAYTLHFSDSSIFGTGTISVPNGGLSGFFSVLTLTTQTPKKYSLKVSGISPASDPQIQVDPNGTLTNLNVKGAQLNVRWTAASNLMQYQDAHGVWQRFPAGGLPIAFGDNVQFSAVLTPPQDFEIVFPPVLNPLNVWKSPFYISETTFPATNHGALETTVNLLVADQNEHGHSFVFEAILTDGSNPSGPFQLNLT